MKRIIHTIFWSFAALWLPAQSVLTSIRHISVEDGLPHRQVHHVFQDSKGFLWVSTQSGISRYDGQEFKVFSRTEHGFSRGLTFNILEDKRGRLWFQQVKDFSIPEKNGTWSIDVFDRIEQRAKTLAATFELPFSMGDIHWVGGDASHNIWLSLKDGALYKFDGQGFMLIAKDAPSEFFEDIAVTPDGRIGMLRGKQLLVSDTLGNVLNTVALPDSVQRIYAGINGRIWLEQYLPYTKKHGKDLVTELICLWFFDKDGASVRPILTDKGQPADFDRYWFTLRPTCQDKAGRLWVFQNEYVNVLDTSGKLLIADVLDGDGSDELKPWKIDFEYHNPFHINFDHNNDAWLATANGLLQVSTSVSNFTNYLTPSDNTVDTRGIIEDRQGNLYIVAAGLHKINKKTGAAERICDFGYVGAIRDRAGDLWLGDYVARAIRYLPTKNKHEIFQHEDYDPLGGPIAARELYQDTKTGQLWIGTFKKGLAYVDTLQKELVSFTKYNEYPGLAESGINAFVENKDGVYLSSTSGLYLLDPQKGIINHFGINTGDLPFENLLHLHIDGDGVFWLGTSGGGLLRWDRKAGNCQQFTTVDGLSDNTIYAVYEDGFNYLWLPSNNGLMRFHKETHRVNTYLKRDGIPHKEFNTGSHYRGADGRLYFGGLGGVTAFYPKDFLDKTGGNIQHSIQILQFEKFNSKGEVLNETKGFLKNKQIVLLPSDRSFYLKFILPNFVEGDKVSYAYKIEGWQEEWNFMEENFLRINGLPYGNYKLQLKARSSRGRETAQNLSIPVFVEKPFYYKTWFLTLSGILLMGAATGFYKWRTYQLKKDKKRLEQEVTNRTKTVLSQKTLLEEQNKQLENLNATKDRFFAIIAHDMRNAVYNFRGVTDKINYFIKRKQPQRINEFGEQIDTAVSNLTNLMDNLLDWALQQKNAIPYNPVNIQLAEKTAHILNSVRGQAERKGIDISANMPETIFIYADENGTATILRNLISNSIKYTHRGDTVSISAKKEKDYILIKIKDTGIGMSVQQQRNLFSLGNKKTKKGTAGEKGSGLGLVLVKELVELNKGKIIVESEEGKGTAVQVFLPIGEVSVAANYAEPK
ncbi:MAG TPA: sensor histidine kinase [Bacteroidetes bacterium]|nr:sensor histidine kinase [Bacteroidota bacterium]